MKTSTQLKALIRNLSKQKNVEAEIILRNFMLERLLERVSISKYRDNFIVTVYRAVFREVKIALYAILRGSQAPNHIFL